ncbi:MAG: site-2 protease family protein [bacterium]|nr:site-2 protease family protein [bacterium]
MLIFIAVLTLIALIIIHELGHFIAAKKLGVKVEEFGLGYPPRIWGKKVGETLYSINLLPFGGFVRIYGQEGKINDPSSFSEKPFWKKSIIILGGVFSFWVISAIILSVVMVLGVPSEISDDRANGVIDPKVQVLGVAPESPAEIAGLKMGDIIRGVNAGGQELSIDKVRQIQEITQDNKGESITLRVQRGGETLNLDITPRVTSPKNEGPMGVALTRTALINYPWYTAPIKGIESTLNLTLAIVQSWIILFSSLFSGKGLPPGAEVTGVVGIFQLFSQVGGLGVSYFLQFIALIAVNLALINSLPIPALDGGWFMFMVIEKLRGKALNEKVIQAVSASFFFLLIALMIWVTIRDIIRIF